MLMNKKRKILALCLSLVMMCSFVCLKTTSSAETNPSDEFEEEEVITFKDKQGLTYSTLGTAKTIDNPTSIIEVSVAEEDREKVSGEIIIPANIVYPKNGKKYQVTMGLVGFYSCKKITSVVLPASWKTCGSIGFAECENLRSVTLKAPSVKRIDGYAFSYCHKLSTVKNIQRVKEIGEWAFRNCYSLKKLKLDQVVSIGDGAFQGCKKLSTITIGKKFKELGASAFSRCKELKTITIKSTKLKKVRKNALKGTSHKITIKVPKKKLAAYKKLFKNKGNKKVVVKVF